MSTVLVVLALIGRLQMPQYVVRYPTQQLSALLFWVIIIF